MTSPPPRLVVASNRLPVVVEHRAVEGWTVSPAVGGLVTALLPVLRSSGGTWVGWAGVAGDDPGIDAALDSFVQGERYDFASVSLSADDVKGFYRGFSNEIVWPLFHDLFSSCVFEPAYWDSYREVNRRFARVIAGVLDQDDVVWVQDYHLMHVATELRAMGLHNRVGFFLHVPFPGPDIFFKLPWRESIMDGLLAFDQIGFQAEGDRRNFLACAERLAGPAEQQPDPSGVCFRPGVGHGANVEAGVPGREVVVSTFPISIDFEEFAARAASPQVCDLAEHLRQEFRGRHLILGVDRLDYSKGLPQKLAAFRLMLERHPDLRRRVSFVQHVVPSREDVPGYHEQRLEVERLVGEINGSFSEPGWVPVHYYYHTLARDDLLAWYRIADIAFITPLKDGMNLVAKEYCACRVNDLGVLILSEFAGASSELGTHALLVNPFDVEGVALSLHQAYEMPRDEQRRRMVALRNTVRENDVHTWAQRCLAASLQGRCIPRPVDPHAGNAGRPGNPEAIGKTGSGHASVQIPARDFDLVLFDLDGVLTQTARIHAAAWKEAFDAFPVCAAGGEGLAFDPAADYLRHVDGKPRLEGARDFLASRGITVEEGGPDDPPGAPTLWGIGSAKDRCFNQRLERDGVEVYGAGVSLLGKLARCGIRCGIVSASRNARRVLRAAGLLEKPDVVVDGNDAAREGLAGKPSPDTFLAAARRLDVPASRAVVIEDAEAGVAAGRTGGFGLVIGVDRADHASALREHGAHRVVRGLDRLEPVGLSSPLEAAAEIQARLAGRQPVVLLDYDGTLTPIVERPRDAVLSPDMRAILSDLARACTVAVISGRGLDVLRELLGLDQVILVADHGFQVQCPGEDPIEPAGVAGVETLIARVAQELRASLGAVPGVIVEAKRFSVAVHYRLVAEPAVAAVKAAVRDVLEAAATLRLLPGKKVMELQPDVAWDKGASVRWLMARFSLVWQQVVYVGDDVTDESAFRVLREAGTAVVVQDVPRPTAACYRLADVQEVGRFLQWLAVAEGRR